MDLTDEQQLLTEIYERLKTTVSEIDATLLASLDAELIKQRQTIGKWGSRFSRVLKKKNETSVDRIRKLHTKLFPNNSLQERRDNMMQFHLATEADLISELHAAIEPFATDLGIVSV
jgi:uncharacterized protein YllA (UPF0747 family)